MTVNVVEPVPFIPVVTDTEFGWLTKKPVQPTPAANRERAANPAISDIHRLEFSIVKTPERTR